MYPHCYNTARQTFKGRVFMSELDVVRDLAKQTLIIPTSTSDVDNSLWDRAQRLVHNAKHICQLPELAKAGLQIDRFCLITATYFSDAGIAGHLKAEETTATSALSNAKNDYLLDLCTKVVEEKLESCIDKARIKKINTIITESNGHFTKSTEAMILSDARNLDDMGATGIFNEFRRLASHGKGLCDALQSWKKKIDYRYWQARLKESFRFESVRKLAEQRLSAAEYFMNQLKVETDAQDLRELIIKKMDFAVPNK